MLSTEVRIDEEIQVLAGDIDALRQVGAWKRQMRTREGLDMVIGTSFYAPVVLAGDRVHMIACAAEDLRPGDVVLCFIRENIDFRRVMEVCRQHTRTAIVVDGLTEEDEPLWVLGSQVVGKAAAITHAPSVMGTLRGTVQRLSAAFGVLGLQRGHVR